MSQEKSGAEALRAGPSSQVQKSRKGTNRIGASRLHQIASVLGVQVESSTKGPPARGRAAPVDGPVRAADAPRLRLRLPLDRRRAAPDAALFVRVLLRRQGAHSGVVDLVRRNNIPSAAADVRRTSTGPETAAVGAFHKSDMSGPVGLTVGGFAMASRPPRSDKTGRCDRSRRPVGSERNPPVATLELSLYQAESVSEGHPDKVCDRTSSGRGRRRLHLGEMPECPASPARRWPRHKVVIGGRGPTVPRPVTAATTSPTLAASSRIKDNRLTSHGDGFPHWGHRDRSDGAACNQHVGPNLAQGLSSTAEGAGRTRASCSATPATETPELMPAPIFFAHKILKTLADARKSGESNVLGPDAKSQVTVPLRERQAGRRHPDRGLGRSTSTSI